jgi:hypothetical protein
VLTGVVAGMWSLSATLAVVERTAREWRRLALIWDQAAERVNRAAGRVGPWDGETAETYGEHRRRLTRDLRSAAVAGRRAASEIDAAAGDVRMAQAMLEAGFASVTHIRHQIRRGAPVFSPANDEQTARLRAAVADATEVTEWLDEVLAGRQVAIAKVARRLATLGEVWRAAADGAATFVVPAQANQMGIIFDAHTRQLTIDTGSGNDTVEVSRDPVTGQTVVTFNDIPHTARDAASIVIRTGAGNDKVTVAPEFPVHLTVLAGEGDDTVTTGSGDDRVYAGGGDDVVVTGAGDDRVNGDAGIDRIYAGQGDDHVDGGTGKDIIHGGRGADRLLGGAGDDYIDGGRGDDVVFGDEGGDIVSGGHGNDVLNGGDGDDAIYTGAGSDLVAGGDGTDTAYGQYRTNEDDIDTETAVYVRMTGNPGDSIVILGTREFRDQVADELDMLRSSPAGRRMLDEMDRVATEPLPSGGERTVIIREGGRDHLDIVDTTYTILHLPTFIDPFGDPPIAGLFHEMGHVYANAHGVFPPGSYTGPDQVDRDQPNEERVVTGLPIDHDNNPRTPDQYYEPFPFELSQSQLHDEMLRRRRPHYGWRP